MYILDKKYPYISPMYQYIEGKKNAKEPGRIMVSRDGGFLPPVIPSYYSWIYVLLVRIVVHPTCDSCLLCINVMFRLQGW
ncbi:Uncharacterized protein TCM_044462 [Theobroma cacao]|uniref:Uncharacterized protein n=1 Tax=Theobroma cacao TaxID=3641 RepID=A0A061FRS4_THECC|nr:Uncharacterized protein TCM_044462 [Theobroma cacao]